VDIVVTVETIVVDIASTVRVPVSVNVSVCNAGIVSTTVFKAASVDRPVTVSVICTETVLVGIVIIVSVAVTKTVLVVLTFMVQCVPVYPA
jgi:hypothetical protein